MKRSYLLLLPLLTLSLLVSTFVCSVDAAPRTFVSAEKGNDAKPCTLDQPCRQFTKALAEVDSGGQIIALDSGGYSPFSINKSVSILAAPGALVTIIAGGGLSPTVAININPLSAGVEVVLRGLTLKAGAVGETGIFFAAAVLHVENCQIDGFQQNGLKMASSGQLFVKDTVFTNVSSNSSAGGIQIVGTASAKARAKIDHCRFENNGTGLRVGANSEVTISNSQVGGGSTGIRAHTSTDGAPGPIELNVENCVVTNAAFGVQSDASFGSTSLVRISNSTITNNATFGVLAVSGTAVSRGNNTIEGNGTDIFGALGAYTAK